MSTLADRHLDVQDLVAAALTTAVGAAATVTRDYIAEDQLDDLSGRLVLVFGPEDGARQAEVLNRSEVVNGFKVSVRCYERYTDAGRPTKAWVDARVSFVDTLYTALDYVTEGSLLSGTLWTETLEITDVANLEAVDELKLFFAEIEAEFREIANG